MRSASHAYLICTSPRSGSTLLCEGLRGTRRAGAPAEFFDDRPDAVDYWKRHFLVLGMADYLNSIVDFTSTPNGVFGAKIHWTNYAALRRVLQFCMAQRFADVRHLSLDTLMRARFPQVHYIWLRRRNKVAQGISHYLVTRTNSWERFKDKRAEDGTVTHPNIEFNFTAIDYCIYLAREYDLHWELYCARQGLRPMAIYYEDLVTAYDPTLQQILEALDQRHDDLPPLEPRLERMAGARSLAWERRYLELTAGGDD
jgi:LPS sulfotransferase NodH